MFFAFFAFLAVFGKKCHHFAARALEPKILIFRPCMKEVFFRSTSELAAYERIYPYLKSRYDFFAPQVNLLYRFWAFFADFGHFSSKKHSFWPCMVPYTLQQCSKVIEIDPQRVWRQYESSRARYRDIRAKHDIKKTNKGIASSILTWGSKIDFAQNVPKLRQTTKNGYTKHKNNQKKNIFSLLGSKSPFLIPFCAVFLFLRT